MSCFNKNTKEYIALTEEYGAPFVVDTHISNWQSYNRSKEIPTPQQVEDFLQRRDALFNIKKREFSETIIRSAIYVDIPTTLSGKIITAIKIFLNN